MGSNNGIKEKLEFLKDFVYHELNQLKNEIARSDSKRNDFQANCAGVYGIENKSSVENHKLTKHRKACKRNIRQKRKYN